MLYHCIAIYKKRKLNQNPVKSNNYVPVSFRPLPFLPNEVAPHRDGLAHHPRQKHRGQMDLFFPFQTTIIRLNHSLFLSNRQHNYSVFTKKADLKTSLCVLRGWFLNPRLISIGVDIASTIELARKRDILLASVNLGSETNQSSFP